jgi:hypothetical protein
MMQQSMGGSVTIWADAGRTERLKMSSRQPRVAATQDRNRELQTDEEA